MSNDLYDPNAPESDSVSRSQYISKKDVKILAVALCALALILWPVYLGMKGQSEKSRCITNIGAIYKAMGMYAEVHDGRLPPVYQAANDGVTPALGSVDVPWTFISDISTFMPSRASFACPSASKEELYKTESPSGGVITASYGMYLPYGTFLPSEIPDPSRTILIAETSNGGTAGSYDPLPFKYDGFAIGWNNSNTEADKQTASVTRLAFRDSSNGVFGEQAYPRHKAGIHAVTANGHLISLKTPDALVKIQRSTNLPSGMWAVP